MGPKEWGALAIICLIIYGGCKNKAGQDFKARLEDATKSTSQDYTDGLSCKPLDKVTNACLCRTNDDPASQFPILCASVKPFMK